jgi:hypothetical protein
MPKHKTPRSLPWLLAVAMTLVAIDSFTTYGLEHRPLSLVLAMVGTVFALAMFVWALSALRRR